VAPTTTASHSTTTAAHSTSVEPTVLATTVVPGGSLAHTGTDIREPVLVGLVALVIGALLLLLGRRPAS
jgi:LPXTG-motif cell wall-anchored protein